MHIQEIIVSRDLRNFNVEDYQMDLMSLPWTKIYDQDDPNLIADMIIENVFIFSLRVWETPDCLDKRKT